MHKYRRKSIILKHTANFLVGVAFQLLLEAEKSLIVGKAAISINVAFDYLCQHQFNVDHLVFN